MGPSAANIRLQRPPGPVTTQTNHRGKYTVLVEKPRSERKSCPSLSVAEATVILSTAEDIMGSQILSWSRSSGRERVRPSQFYSGHLGSTDCFGQHWPARHPAPFCVAQRQGERPVRLHVSRLPGGVPALLAEWAGLQSTSYWDRHQASDSEPRNRRRTAAADLSIRRLQGCSSCAQQLSSGANPNRIQPLDGQFRSDQCCH